MVGRVAAHCCAAGHVLPLLPCARGSATCVSDAWLTRCHHLCEGLGRVVWCGIGLFFLSAFFLSRCSPLFCAPSPSCTQLTQPSSCAFVLCTRLIAVSTGGTSAAHGHRGLGSASDGAANTRMSQCVVTTVCAADDTHTLSALEQISAGLGSRCVHPLTTHTHTHTHRTSRRRHTWPYATTSRRARALTAKRSRLLVCGDVCAVSCIACRIFGVFRAFLSFPSWLSWALDTHTHTHTHTQPRAQRCKYEQLHLFSLHERAPV
jgi:hypothetical protein